MHLISAPTTRWIPRRTRYLAPRRLLHDPSSHISRHPFVAKYTPVNPSPSHRVTFLPWPQPAFLQPSQPAASYEKLHRQRTNCSQRLLHACCSSVTRRWHADAVAASCSAWAHSHSTRLAFARAFAQTTARHEAPRADPPPHILHISPCIWDIQLSKQSTEARGGLGHLFPRCASTLTVLCARAGRVCFVSSSSSSSSGSFWWRVAPVSWLLLVAGGSARPPCEILWPKGV